MKICWFGVYNLKESRNRIYIRGFKELGVEIIECRDDSNGLLKYFKLFKKHWKIRNNYDFLVVGYPGHPVVWLAKLLSNKPIIFDALCTVEEGVIISREEHNRYSLKYFYIRFIDWLAVKSADLVLVESEAQRIFFEGKFGKSDKYKVVYTGADDSIFYPDNIKKREKFAVVFRGKFLPEAGVKYVLRAAKILENSDVGFLILGNGWLQDEVKKEISILNLKNLEWISDWLAVDDVRKKMLECNLSLGQFENHERLKRTIPHKAYESLALGLPYITAQAQGISEILTEGENCLMVKPADPKDLADKILQLKNDPKLAEKIANSGLDLYRGKFTPTQLAKKIKSFLMTF